VVPVWSRELTLPSVSSTLLSFEIILPYNLASLLLYSLTVSFSLLYPIFTSLIEKMDCLLCVLAFRMSFCIKTNCASHRCECAIDAINVKVTSVLYPVSMSRARNLIEVTQAKDYLLSGSISSAFLISASAKSRSTR